MLEFACRPSSPRGVSSSSPRALRPASRPRGKRPGTSARGSIAERDAALRGGHAGPGPRGERGQEAVRAILRRVPPRLPRRPLLQPDRPRRRGRHARPLSSRGRPPRPADARRARAARARPPLGRARVRQPGGVQGRGRLRPVHGVRHPGQRPEPVQAPAQADRRAGRARSGSGWSTPSRSTWTPLLDFAERAYRRPLDDPGARRPAKPLRQAPEAGPRSRRGLPADAGPRPGRARVPLPRRAAAAGRRAAAACRTGSSPAGSATSSGRRCPTTSCGGWRPRASFTTRRCWRPRPGGCSRTTGPGRWPPSSPASGSTSAASTSTTRRASSSSRVRRAARRDVRGVDPVLPRPLPARRLRARRPRRRPHVPQRAAGQALRHPRRRPAPSGGGSTASRRTAAAASWGWQRPGQAVRRVADQPGPARQLGGRDAARREAAQAAGERARSCPRASSTPAA